MASNSLLRNTTRPDLYVCASCALKASRPSRTARRWVHMKYLVKVADAEERWAEQAKLIQAGKKKSMLSILEERGLVEKFTGNRESVDAVLTNRRLGAYVGVDPTAPSLHVGNLAALMPLFWMYIHGYHTVSLIGGATAKIGDPTDRLTSRQKESPSVRTANMANMHLQLKKLWQNVASYASRYGYHHEWAWHRELVNNGAWWNGLPMLEVLQILGPGMRMGSMLARETVKNKMTKGDGMSYAEFTYPLMQAWDWWHMYHTKGISMQIGGSDQYGNITAGIDAIKYIRAHHPNDEIRNGATKVPEPFGLTVPLLTTAAGQKFGKSAGNAVWLSLEQTSSFELYGYFLRTADADVKKFLKMFTFYPSEKIDLLVQEHMKSPSLRIAQHKLAREFVELVHGHHEAKDAEMQHRILFQKAPNLAAPSANVPREPDGDAKAGITTVNNAPTANIKLPRSLIYQRSIGRILYAAGIADSVSEGQRLVTKEGAYIGGPPHGGKEPMNENFIQWAKIRNWRPEETKLYLVHGDLLMLRRGKNNVRIVQIIPDEDYVSSGESYPGMTEEWRERVLEAAKVEGSLKEKDQTFMSELFQEPIKDTAARLLAEDEEDNQALFQKRSH